MITFSTKSRQVIIFSTGIKSRLCTEAIDSFLSLWYFPLTLLSLNPAFSFFLLSLIFSFYLHVRPVFLSWYFDLSFCCCCQHIFAPAAQRSCPFAVLLNFGGLLLEQSNLHLQNKQKLDASTGGIFRKKALIPSSCFIIFTPFASRL